MAKNGIKCCICGVRTTRFVPAKKFGFDKKACEPCGKVVAAHPEFAREDVLSARMPPMESNRLNLDEGSRALLEQSFKELRRSPGALSTEGRRELEARGLRDTFAELIAASALAETDERHAGRQVAGGPEQGPCAVCGAPGAGYRVFQRAYVCDACEAQRAREQPDRFKCSVCSSSVSSDALCIGCFSHVCDGCVGQLGVSRPVGFHDPSAHPGPPRSRQH